LKKAAFKLMVQGYRAPEFSINQLDFY